MKIICENIKDYLRAFTIVNFYPSSKDLALSIELDFLQIPDVGITIENLNFDNIDNTSIVDIKSKVLYDMLKEAGLLDDIDHVKTFGDIYVDIIDYIHFHKDEFDSRLREELKTIRNNPENWKDFVKSIKEDEYYLDADEDYTD
jgi:hypothetical protein